MKRLLILFAAALCISPALAAEPETAPEQSQDEAPPPDQWTIIHAGTLIARPGEAPQHDQSIVVKNDRIDSIRPGFLTADDVEAGASIIELRHSFVLPGLIDAHVHLSAGSIGDFYYPDEAEDAYGVLTVIEDARKTVEAGFTTVRDLGSDGWAVAAVSDGISVGAVKGPRILRAERIIHIGAGKEDGASCYDPGSCRKAVLENVARGAEWIKVYGTCSGFQACGGEDGQGLFFQDEFSTIVKTAAAYHIPVTTHAHGTDGINDALKAGVRSIEHGTFADNESRKLLLKTGAYLVPTLSVLDVLKEGDEDIMEIPLNELDKQQKVIRQALEEHPKRVALAHKMGVKIGVGSDAGVTAHGENANELFWLVKIGMSPAEAIRAATLINAKLLMMEDDLGTVEPGKYADIIAVGANPLEDIEALKSVRFVMAAGTVALDVNEENEAR